MDNRIGKTLLAVTTYNQLNYTKYCVDSIKKLDDVPLDLVVIDDYSTDGTVKWLKENDVKVFDKNKPLGLTHSWNIAYQYFRDNKKYKYLIIANNDIIIPNNAILELVKVVTRWPVSVVVPMSTVVGAGHNAAIQGLEKIYQGVDPMFICNPNNVQATQDQLLAIKKSMKDNNTLYMLDPRRMKMFNGFFFLMTRDVIEYEDDAGMLFDPKFIMLKAEDEFNWSKLIPNDDFAAVCQTSFIFHFKGITLNEIKDYKNITNTKDFFKIRDESYKKIEKEL